MSLPPLIRRKRDGGSLSDDELRELLSGFQSGSVPDYQMAALLMAIYFQGLSAAELDVLVQVMLESGGRVDFGDAPGRRIDKHSTGGVGDKVSLILAPLAASLGIQVPMMSGRGLGHSGGTVDKLESIPGMRLDLPLDRFREQVLDLGLALISQTPDIAPLDGRLYALRDVTATVESIPLISASIMSKKIAEGIDGLVLDVKVGNGAFIPEEQRAIELARTMIGIGRQHGREVVALITAMDRPLGKAVGNALEVAEAVEVLRGAGPADVREVSAALTAEMLLLAEGAVGPAASDRATARARARADEALNAGSGLEVLARVIEAQGGDPRIVDEPDRLPRAPVRRPVESERAGRVTSVATRALGEAAVALGAGRKRLEDEIDPRVGFVLAVSGGDRVETGQPLAEVHAASEADAEGAARAIRSALTIDDSEPAFRPLISHRITAHGVERLA